MRECEEYEGNAKRGQRNKGRCSAATVRAESPLLSHCHLRKLFGQLRSCTQDAARNSRGVTFKTRQHQHAAPRQQRTTRLKKKRV